MLVFKGVSLLITIYAGLLLVLAHMINPGLHHIREYLLTDRLLEENSVARLLLAIFLFFLLVTALVMISSETYARTMRPQVARIEQESTSPGFITNPIPFLSLDICVVLVFVKQIILRFLFKITVPPWLLLFLLCSVRPSKYHEPKEIVFIVDNFEPLLCQEHSASDTDSQ